jgi:hypothetical protein
MILAAAAVAVAPMTVSAPASAAHAGAAAAAAAPCLTGSAARLASARKVPEWRQRTDTNGVTQKDLDALPLRETRPKYIARQVEPRLPAWVWVPVYVHVIRGTHKRDKPRITNRAIANMINILNRGMEAKQSSYSTASRYRFYVHGITRTRKDSWYHAYLNGPRDRQAKQKLHRGNARALNLYFNGGGTASDQVLGWSRFPWQYAYAPKLDGVSINVASVPGGRARGYNLGDTLIHETGHWMGLFHTFQGGCDDPGDYVTDTAPEAEPSYFCQVSRDTCLEPGLDPVRNFMDYSLDACMNMFTAGQVRRMDAAFEKWRY